MGTWGCDDDGSGGDADGGYEQEDDGCCCDWPPSGYCGGSDDKGAEGTDVQDGDEVL